MNLDVSKLYFGPGGVKDYFNKHWTTKQNFSDKLVAILNSL